MGIEELPEEKEYYLKCRVKRVEHPYYEIADKRWHETKSYLLLPDLESAETARFFYAWLPEVGPFCLDCHSENVRLDDIKCPDCKSEKIKVEHSECPAFIAEPIGSPCRMAVLRKNNYCHQHHLLVMSTGVEDELHNIIDRDIRIIVLKASQDELCDSAPTTAHKPRT